MNATESYQAYTVQNIDKKRLRNAQPTIKNTPNLLFEYQCTSGKFVRLPNRMESNRNFFLARIGMLYFLRRPISPPASISSELHVQPLPNVLCMLPMAVVQFSIGGVIAIFVRRAYFIFMDDITLHAMARNTQDDITSQNLWSRYVRHFVGITWHNVCNYWAKIYHISQLKF